MSDLEGFNVETKHGIFHLLLQKLCNASDWLMRIKSDDILVGEDNFILSNKSSRFIRYLYITTILRKIKNGFSRQVILLEVVCNTGSTDH